MAIGRVKGQLLLCVLAAPWHLEMIQLPIQRENATTGARGQLDPQLFQCCADAIFSELRIDLQFLHFLHRSQRRFHRRLVRPTRLVDKPGELLFDPSFEGRMDRLPRRTQIACD